LSLYNTTFCLINTNSKQGRVNFIPANLHLFYYCQNGQKNTQNLLQPLLSDRSNIKEQSVWKKHTYLEF